MKNSFRNWREFVFLIPSLAGVSVFVFLPFADVVRRSFMNATGRVFTWLDNYQTVVQNPAFRLAMGNTGRFLVVCVPLVLIISLLLANVIHFCSSSLGRRRQFLRNICLLPLAAPVASLIFVWQMVFHKNGLINTYLDISMDWLNSPFAFWVLAATFLWKNMGYYVVLWLAGLEAIPEELYEAAAVDGAGAFAKFRYVILPGLRPMLSAAFVLAVTATLKSYRESYLLAGEYPDRSIYMVQHLFHNWFRDMSVEKMSAGAVVLVGIFAVMVLPLRKKGAWNLEK